MPELYDDPFSDGATEIWEYLKSKYKMGDTIRGAVVHQAPYGVFLDAGLGFHVLLEVPEFEHAETKRFIFPDDYPRLGTVIEANLTVFQENGRQIYVTQRFGQLHRK